VEKTMQAHVIARAAEILGGVDELASRLEISAGVVRVWMDGKLALPQRVFFELVDIIGEADARRAPAKGEAEREQDYP
jgi:hypothetical protein